MTDDYQIRNMGTDYLVYITLSREITVLDPYIRLY